MAGRCQGEAPYFLIRDRPYTIFKTGGTMQFGPIAKYWQQVAHQTRRAEPHFRHTGLECSRRGFSFARTHFKNSRY